MITLTTPIPVAKAIPNVRKWRVASVQDDDTALYIEIECFGAGADFYSRHTLVVRDGGPCVVLQTNPAPQNALDQVVVSQTTIAGTPYTTLSGVWNGNTTPATRAGRCRALEQAIAPGGVVPLLSAEFAGA